ncbi:hypothetical protein CCO03_10100 [Comamonas serinivorans]|uniref:Phospholipid/glycerol acyltransferase domain-containing protein n=1 Tax=Comamonas serinivorans TaxID=1082851 RepID=A0A1Y0ENG4_9BURK|nr:lysophospholipid acyltransferase family protein [Comamonas serinivorans]ARU04988.1 hypothetical protein CCO03_10100 [Comamonas serinivorans]
MTAPLNRQDRASPTRPVGSAALVAFRWLAMVLGLGVLGLMCLAWTPFALVLRGVLPRDVGSAIGRRVISYCFRFYVGVLRVACGCRIDLSELDALTRERRPLVVVANHPSLLDAVLIVSRLPNAVCIMKGAVAHNAFLGAGAQLAGYVSNVSALSVVRGALQDLKRHQSQLVIFPEGTRTGEGPIGDCGATAGVIAARAQVPVQTLVITMSERYLGKGWPLFRPPPLPLHIRVEVSARFRVVPALADEFGHDLKAWYRARLEGQPSPVLRALVPEAGGQP